MKPQRGAAMKPQRGAAMKPQRGAAMKPQRGAAMKPQHGAAMTTAAIQGRKIYGGLAAGEALVTRMGISFFGGVDPDTGVIVEKGHELEGQSISGRVLVFPSGKGSTVGSYTLYRLKINGKAPAAIINAECETITAVGCIIAEIPCVDHVPLDALRTGMQVSVNGDQGLVEF